MPDYKRNNTSLKIAELMNSFIAENHLKKGLNKIRIEEIWKEQMGNGVNAYTNKLILKGDTLEIQLNSSVLREELRFQKEKLLEMINEAFDEPVIKRIKLA